MIGAVVLAGLLAAGLALAGAARPQAEPARVKSRKNNAQDR